VLAPSGEYVCQCCFSNAGHQFAAVQGNVIHVYSTVTHELLVNLKGHNNRVRALVWTDNDLELISAGTDGAVYEWQVLSLSLSSLSLSLCVCVCVCVCV